MCTEPDVEVAQEDKACTGPLLSPSCLYMFQSDIPVGKMMKNFSNNMTHENA
jgi:hypothetical protein